MHTKKTTRLLFHKISDEEKEEMTKSLTEQMLEVVKLETEKKDNAAHFKRRIDTLKEHNNNLATWIHDGGREMSIACEVRFNHPSPGIKTIVRGDTFESWEEPMDPSEYTLDTLSPDEQ